jgi:hypothetical protein
MYSKGFIKIERKLAEHWIFQDSEKLKWWLILLLEVNYLPGKVMIGNNLIQIDKGQSAKSLRSWAKLLNTGTKSVVSFFDLLESDKMLKRETVGKGKQSTTLITIENYEHYQGIEKRKSNAKETQAQREGHTIEERKKGKKNIIERKKDFRQSLTNFNKENPDKYPKELYVDFESYWAQYGENDKKMLFEKQKSFGLSQRLSRWYTNDFDGKYKKKVKRLNTFD